MKPERVSIIRTHNSLRGRPASMQNNQINRYRRISLKSHILKTRRGGLLNSQALAVPVNSTPPISMAFLSHRLQAINKIINRNVSSTHNHTTHQQPLTKASGVIDECRLLISRLVVVECARKPCAHPR